MSASSPRTVPTARRFHFPLAGVLVLLFGGALTAAATWLVARSQDAHERLRFERLVDSASDEVRARVHLYQYGVRGARGLFAASKSVERHEFLEYYESRDYPSEFPGALGVGYIHRVARADLDRYVEAVRADGAPDFQVQTTRNAGDLYVVQFLEPHASNEMVIGHDIACEPRMREAAEHAMRTGRGMITAKVDLLQRPGEEGFLYFMPVYARGAHPETPAEREQALVGWTYMPLVVSRILADATERVDGLVAFRAYDGEETTPENLLHDGLAALGRYEPAHEETVELVVADRVWKLQFASTPAFDAVSGLSPRLVTLLVGALATLFLAGLVWSVSSREQRAVELTALRTRELEEARRTAESATQVKAEFLANMSHELRTPMTAILGFAHVLQEQGLDEEERAQHVRTINRNGEHLLAILNDILDSSKLDAGRMTVERIPCSPRAVLEDVINLLAHKASEKGVLLALEAVGPIPDSITTDPTRWKQILVNVVGNALKFTEKGHVRLRVGLAPGVAGSEPMFLVDVQDTGIGMEEAQLVDLFRPFQQADASTTRRFGGTGLGLTISKALAELLGGGIEVDSEVGRGSSFRVRVAAGDVVHAAAAPALAQTTGPASSDEPRMRGRVLLAEDGRDNQVLISRVLRKAGATVEIVGDGAQAIEAAWAAHAAGTPFGLILMDMHMPEVDGRAATRELRSRGYRGPIIALTASAMNEDRIACFEAGCDEFASKPLRTKELVALCRRYLEPVSAA